MPVFREDTDTFLMFHKRARPRLDNRLTALLNYELIKVPFLPVNYMYIILYIRDSGSLVTRYQYFYNSYLSHNVHW